MQCRYLLLLPVMASMLSGQQSDIKPAEPEAIGVACYLDPVTHTIKALPNEQGKAVGKAKAGFAHVNATGFLEFVGVSSSFQVPVSEKNEFVFKLLNADLSRIKLYKGAQDSKKGLRRFEVTQERRKLTLSEEPRLQQRPWTAFLSNLLSMVNHLTNCVRLTSNLENI